MKKFVFFIIIFLVILIAGRGYYSYKSLSNQQNNTDTDKTSSMSIAAEIVKKTSDYFFPLPDYFSRISVKHFGQMVKSSDRFEVPCGANFSGLHNGDDLEVSPTELNTEVAVLAAATGKVLQLGHISGYGGLLVQSAKLNGDEVTIYYGHINYKEAKVKSGEDIFPGEIIAFLGKGCSEETDGERKHLHFAIHKGTAVDVRGYVPNENVLSNWVNPGETLKNIVVE